MVVVVVVLDAAGCGCGVLDPVHAHKQSPMSKPPDCRICIKLI